jgi:hypothetical protein
MSRWPKKRMSLLRLMPGADVVDRRQSQPDRPGAGQSGGQCHQIYARGGKVRIRAAITSDGVDLSVADSGPGIPEADRPRVTERFVALEASRNSPGTGLGLSLVAAVAHFHQCRAAAGGQCAAGLKAVLRFPLTHCAHCRPRRSKARLSEIATAPLEWSTQRELAQGPPYCPYSSPSLRSRPRGAGEEKRWPSAAFPAAKTAGRGVRQQLLSWDAWRSAKTARLGEYFAAGPEPC